MVEIVAVNREQRIALTDSNDICHITQFIDSEGDETNEPAKAVSAVARLDDQNWFAINLSAFDPAGEH